ncbi:MAG: pyridoxamine 5'-phosphate oxidase [Pseudomonadales bacterium]|jgi:pyridoxamine 5'-phosphate oxidase|nr:pyridoxamine 5'-phosphate oxidase [Pseudomonadales bacterium]|tara:strand:+ start:10326 stop:10949 length:624 start_codon:yes stop_codon:yes gene_type:complete
MRREYSSGPLLLEDMADSPFDQFQKWMQEAVRAEVQDPTAMCLATVGQDGNPSQRTVLLKQFDTSGFVFFTNLESRKAEEIANNSAVCLHFAWLELNRQVTIEGDAKKLGIPAVLKYFVSRPRESQLAAWASAQSRKLETRAVLENEFMRLQKKYTEGEIPLPSFWGGFKVEPGQWEFWQGADYRLHDRFQYSPEANEGWTIGRLAP